MSTSHWIWHWIKFVRKGSFSRHVTPALPLLRSGRIIFVHALQRGDLLFVTGWCVAFPQEGARSPGTEEGAGRKEQMCWKTRKFAYCMICWKTRKFAYCMICWKTRKFAYHMMCWKTRIFAYHMLHQDGSLVLNLQWYFLDMVWGAIAREQPIPNWSLLELGMPHWATAHG